MIFSIESNPVWGAKIVMLKKVKDRLKNINVKNAKFTNKIEEVHGNRMHAPLCNKMLL
jgi:hypothetical protein